MDSRRLLQRTLWWQEFWYYWEFGGAVRAQLDVALARMHSYGMPVNEGAD